MSSTLLTDEVSAALAGFFYAGDGPRHVSLTNCFVSCGLSGADPYDPAEGTPNKEQRVLSVCRVARRRPGIVADRLLDALLTELRVSGAFDAASPLANERILRLRRALAAQSATLDAEGRLTRGNTIDLGTGGRPALDEQVSRLRRNVEDPGALLGGAKDLLESICKFVLEEQAMLPPHRASFDELLSLALERLRLQPQLVDVSVPGGKQIRAIYQSAKSVASTVNELRNLQGTGHGRTLPTGISQEAGRYVIREATHVAELLLSTHDRQMGRGV